MSNILVDKDMKLIFSNIDKYAVEIIILYNIYLSRICD